MGDEFVVVFSWFFQAQEHDESLLKPVGELEEVVQFEFGSHLPVWVFEPEVFQVVPPAILR